jgi:hypothetical protein
LANPIKHHRNRQTHAEHRQRDRHGHTDADRWTGIYRQKNKHSMRDRLIHRDRQSRTKTDRHKQKNADTDRQTQRNSKRQTVHRQIDKYKKS